MPYQLIAVLLVVTLASHSFADEPGQTTSQPNQVSHQASAERGRAFLVNLVDPEVNLLPEFRGHNVYWLYHDNYLVTKVLAESHPKIVASISAAIKKHGENQSGKIEILFGESERPLPFRQYELVEVHRDDTRVIRTERVTEREMRGWEAYADLRLLAAIALATDDEEAAKKNLDAALQMWNQEHQGFADAVLKTRNIYATYKLAMAVIAAHRLNQMDHLPRGMMEQLRRLQDPTGGWITDYQPDGTPIGKANVETTCLAILAFDCFGAGDVDAEQKDARSPGQPSEH